MIVGIDLDGVAYDFVAAMRHYAHERFGIPLDTMPEAKTWDFPVHDWGWKMHEFLDRFHRGVNEEYIFLEGEPYPGVREGIDRLRDAGHHVHIVTHRESAGAPGVAIRSTATWLALHGISYDSISFTKQKEVVRADVFIEDNVSNFHSLWESGIPSYLRNQPYNALSVWPHARAAEEYWRVPDFTAFVDKALERFSAWGTLTGNLFDKEPAA